MQLFFFAEKQYEMAKNALYFEIVNRYTNLWAQNKCNFYHKCNIFFKCNFNLQNKSDSFTHGLHLLCMYAS